MSQPSLHKFFSRNTPKLLLKASDLPNTPLTTINTINGTINANYNLDSRQPPRSTPCRKGKKYTKWQNAEAARIAEATIKYGPAEAASKMSKILNKKINESTCRSMRKRYVAQQRLNNFENVIFFILSFVFQCFFSYQLEVLPKQAGRPTNLPDEIDNRIRITLTAMRDKDLVVNNFVMRCIGEAIARADCPSVLVQFGGIVQLEVSWARSLLKRMNMVKRKATKSCKADIPNKEKEIAAFQQKLRDMALEFATPPELIVNFDEMGVRMVPVGNWTFERRGAKQVKVDGCDDKREITVTVSSSMSGELLPLQIIYAGTTERCHRNIKYPASFSVTQSQHSSISFETEACPMANICVFRFEKEVFLTINFD